MKTYLYLCFGVTLLAGCATHQPPDFAAFIKSTSKALARKDCISEARLIDFAKNPNTDDRKNIEEWVHRKQNEQNTADPILVGIDKIGVESDVTVKNDDSLTLKPQTTLAGILTLGLSHNWQNDNKLTIGALNVAALSDMPGILFDEKITTLEDKKTDYLKLLSSRETPTNTVSLLTDEFHFTTKELDETVAARTNLQSWILAMVKANESARAGASAK